jgi:hypothetical protein
MPSLTSFCCLMISNLLSTAIKILSVAYVTLLGHDVLFQDGMYSMMPCHLSPAHTFY